MPYAQTLMTSDANGTYRGVYTYGLERISESDQVAVEGVPNDPLFYLYDGRGSVTQLVNTANNVRDKYRYTPFGVPMPGGQLTPNTRLFNNPYGYNGEDYDIESGLQFLRARYYNPEAARFITRDSYLGDVMEPLSLNRYAYTANNPLRYTDPSGHKYVSEDEGNKQVEAYNNLYYKSLSQPAKNGPVLKVGSTDKGSIKELQNMLIDLGYDLGPSGADGDFGGKTKAAVMKFQKSNGLDTDGVVGAKTWKSLQREQTDNENIKSVMKIKQHDYANEKVAQSKTVSKNDVGCGDLGDISGEVSLLSIGKNFALGVYDAGKGTIDGIKQMINDPKGTVNGLKYVAQHPIITGKAIYAELKDTVNNELINGDGNQRSRLVGKIAGEVVLSVISTKGADKIVKGVKGIKETSTASKVVTTVLESADEVEDIGTRAIKIDLQLFGNKKVVEPKLITNKFPDEALPSNGKIIDYTIEDGMFKGLNGQKNVDFVIDSNGKLNIGSKHHYLGDAQDVKAAGQLKLDGQGRVRRIDNKSGHYRPTPNEAVNYPDLLRENGLNVKNSWLELYDIKVDTDGFVEDIIRASSKKIK